MSQALPQLDAIKQLPLLRSLTAEDGIPNPSANQVTGWKLGLMRRVIQLKHHVEGLYPKPTA